MEPHSSTLMTLNGVQNEFLPESVLPLCASPILVFVFASNYLKIIAGTTQQLMTQRSSGYVLALRLHG